jgi:protein SCO1/2
MRSLFCLFVATIILSACQPNRESLPVLGNHIIDPATGDTTYHEIPAFSFVNQDGQMIRETNLDGKVYIADFFFISCPTICPTVARQMKRIHDRFEDDDRLALVSYTIDPKRDTVARLKKYADGLGVASPKWQFLRGEKDVVYDLAQDYMSIAREDPNAPGGFDHSGWLLLIDDQRHIRSFCNGTEEEAVDKFMEDIDLLLSTMGTATSD